METADYALRMAYASNKSRLLKAILALKTKSKQLK